MRRDYPAGVVLHAPHCVEGGNSPALPIDAAYEAYPSHQLHFCFGGMVPAGLMDMHTLQEIMPFVVVEQIQYGPHDYVQSEKWPADAVRPLCGKCQGTHEAARVQAPTPAGLPQRPKLDHQS
ncbi:hypothetical protein AMIS_2310 [Actinoplanes missouriensis 431]|uniref:Uncharacterized protein n=1 Tax=Actinoplanes missouriensis (strain ATCC 14538 / DSM 43046 / CBS 188.64 / JCM 3121 / NBRC 102363 / NCIMB 12654 / NRRL B-3342 / UNCC 431) TaxID=512565 RepID=I0GXG4_ACTM4|nr:hypothetical protein [Actinoplanes missouriensis]BAL85451.1 hypothetical protein AMIS_2310 [Actinoplanes missouriensis 431]